MSLVVDIEKKLGSFTLRSQFETDSGTMALLGASGCGKSVTLKCIAGIMTPDKGRIVLDGETLFDSEQRIDLTPQQRRIGYLFQQYALFPNMTVSQNIQCGIRTGSRAEKQRQASEQLRRFRLEGLEKKYPAQLSGGQQQRVALARILASEPRAILLDEPFSALDSFLKWNLEMELTEVLDSFAGPAIWVSHDRGEAFRNCRWVCVMNQGKTLPAQAMDELFFSPGTEAAARLTGCKNYARAITNGNTVTLPEWGIALRCAEKAGSMVQCVGIRAHSVRPATLGEENAFSCTVERIIQGVFSTIILLRPVGATQEAPLLWMEMDKNNGQKIHNSRTLTVAVAPQQIMLLH